MAEDFIFHPPTPPLFIGGRQPYEPKRLPPSQLDAPASNPPFRYGGPVAVLAAIVSIVQPDPWTYAFAGSGGSGRQPYGQNQLNPSLLAVSVDNPPFTTGGPIAPKAEIVGLHQPDPWSFGSLGPDNSGRQPYGNRQNSP